LLVVPFAAAADWRQWRVGEIEFRAEREYANPAAVQMNVAFTHESGARFVVPAFWDGEKSWKVRFSPTKPGEWDYVTVTEDSSDRGLYGRAGSFSALPATGDNLLFKHGGILSVGENKRYLTHSDGTPFFWLGDTWWFCPSRWCPIAGSANSQYESMYKELIDTRKRQGFTVAQMAFLSDVKDLHRPRRWGAETLNFWREADEYIAYANEAGILPVIGIGFHKDVDKIPMDEYRHLWRYAVARYGSFAVSWLVVGEYNLENDRSRVQKALAIGRFIKSIDPYNRAMTVHPWTYRDERRQAWGEPWYDFIMLQCGHGGVPPVAMYQEAYAFRPIKPVLEGECNYDNVGNTDNVRVSAFRAIQSGSFGYTYGAHNLWYPTQSSEDRRFARYAKPIPWWEALRLPGAVQASYVRKIYETIPWWTLEPRSDLVEAGENLREDQKVLAKSRGDELVVIYFPAGFNLKAKAVLKTGDAPRRYRGIWFNPRNAQTSQFDFQGAQRRTPLPDRPAGGDWVLVLEAKS
jgi:hypothetical protein